MLELNRHTSFTPAAAGSSASSTTQVKEAPAREIRRPRLKIMILRVRLLAPQNTGNRIRTARMIEELGKENDIVLVTYRFPGDTDADVAQTARCCRRLEVIPFYESQKKSLLFYYELWRNLFEPYPYIISKYVSRQMCETVRRVYQEEKPDLVMCDYLQSCEGLRQIPDVPFVLFEHNVEAAIFDQLAERAPSMFSRAYIRHQARKLWRYEEDLCRRAAHVIAVSDVDKEVYRTRFGVSHCDTIPTGVDVHSFRPSSTPCHLNNLVFTGSMDWMANQDGMQWFVRDVFPRIRREIPDCVFTIVGRNPPPEIKKLGEQPGIHVTGTVDDIRPYVHGSKVYIVPLRIGSGTRLKLLEALAMGKAIVSTTIGAEGLPVEHNKNIVLADGERDFAAQTVALLRDTARRECLQHNARLLAERDYSWEKVGRVFNDICYAAAKRMRGAAE
ncbi:MAG TPA: glycosyltransferase [Planctomycetota bacterium]|nr:glycosyltransferase [Planctomycetota bacterium]